MRERTDRPSDLAMARSAGALYLSLAFVAPFTILYLPSRILVPGDAAATAANLLAHESLFRAGLVADTYIFLCEIVLTILLYRLLAPVSRSGSLVAACARLSMNLVQAGGVALKLLALRLAAGPHQDLVLALLNANTDLILVWQAFFGLHCAVLGALVYRSGYLPRALGVMLLLAGAGYLSDSVGRLLAPEYGVYLGWVAPLFGVVGEVSFAAWLLFRGTARGVALKPSGHGALAPMPRA